MIVKMFRGMYGKKTIDRLVWYEFVVWLILGIGAVGYGAWELYETFELRSNGALTTAEITNLNRGTFGTTTLLFTANGETRHIVGEFNPSSEWEIGDKIEIYYLPRNPRVLRQVDRLYHFPFFEIAATISGLLILIDFTYTVKTQPPRRWKNGTVT